MIITPQPPRDRLIKHLCAQGIHNQAVLEAIRTTPRHWFIDPALSRYAYSNHPLPIGYGQTISQPYIVARMTQELLSQGPLTKVLEIGTGCGYQTAILAQLVDHVYTVERIQNLQLAARTHLARLGVQNVSFSYGDGQWGWVELAPYSGILVTAAPLSIPPSLLEQLALGGRLVIPVSDAKGGQGLWKVIRSRTGYQREFLEEVNFVPLCKGVV
jgi:protein-L-isoaspartate(D-aspartate) O-methyltransferase